MSNQETSAGPLSPRPIVGIDLGTTNSLVAIAHWPPKDPAGAAPRCLLDDTGQAMLRSIVRFDAAGRVQAVGSDAASAAAEAASRTIRSVKRLMGRTLADVAADLPYLSYKVVAGAGQSARIELGDSGLAVSPQEVSAHVLRALKLRAEKALGVTVEHAVITVPAYFDDGQRQATREAARLAGLDAVRIVNEPTAAALAYGLGLRHAAGKARTTMNVVVYDLGGGTFDVSILRITPPAAPASTSATTATTSPTAADYFQVLSTSGDTHLGGDDMDAAIVRWLKEKLATNGVDAPALTTLRDAAEAAKIALSTLPKTTIELNVAGSPVRLELTRAEFESMILPLVDRTIAACQRAMRDARRALIEDENTSIDIDRAPARAVSQPIDAVVLVGGATRIPLVRTRVAEFFKLEPYAALDPDQVVALGAAVQGAIIAGADSSALLIDVVPLSLGVETVGGAMAKLIMRNSAVPARASEMFSTSVDNQTGIKLHILQGEREMAADCRSLARLEITGIPPMPAGIPKLRVELAVDVSGILSINAHEERSGKRLFAQVVPNHGLTSAEVDRLDKESLLSARQDMKRHRIADLISHSMIDVAMIQRQLGKHGQSLDPPARDTLTQLLLETSSLISSAQADWSSVDANVFQRTKEALDRASMRLHEIAIAASLRGT